MESDTPVDKTCKFALNELVLCYEPDPLKARVLYDAKVLDNDITKDENGKKVFEYYIHFQGWNKSWDRWVIENQILKISDANRGIQSKLLNKAIQQKKKKKSSSRNDSDDDKDDNSVTSIDSGSVNSDDVKANKLPLVSLNIPKVLSVRLEEDCYNIKRKKKLVHLPRKPTVNTIFNEYYAHCEHLVKTPDGRDVNLNLVYEMIHGLNTYFNFFLFSLFLYNFEREQYHKFFPPGKENQSPRLLTEVITSDSHSKVNSTVDNDVSIPFKDVFNTKSNKRSATKCETMPCSPVKRTRSKSSGSSGSSDLLENNTHKVTNGNINLEKNKTNSETRSSRRTRLKDGTFAPDAECTPSKEKKSKISDKPKSLSTSNTPLSSLEENGNNLRRSVRSRKSSLAVIENDDQQTLPIGSTAKSLQKSYNCKRDDTSKKEESSKPNGMIDEKSYMLYPQHSNGDTPADVYGIEHLLRLFVKLPVLLSSSNIEEGKIMTILKYVSKFLDYLSKRTDLFVDATIVYSESIL